MGITMLQYRCLHSHQTFIKSISLMKREGKMERAYQTPQMMNFSFREQFDEILMRVYILIAQHVNPLIHQIIVFPTIIKLPVILNQLKD